jgi:hypothetical protein
MRLIGEVPHPVFKISVFKMDNKLSVQIADSSAEILLKFRDGMGVDNVDDVKKYLDRETMDSITKQMAEIAEKHNNRIKNYYQDLNDSWPEII